MHYNVVESVDHNRWNDFVAGSPFGDVLQCFEWGEVKRTGGWEPIPLAVESDRQYRATALLLKRRVTPFGHSILYCPRGPILDYGDEALLRTLVVGIREIARRHRAILLKIDPAVPIGEAGLIERLRAVGFRASPDAEGGFGGTQPRCVMKLDLTKSEEELLAAMKNKTRYNLRLAERKGVEIFLDCPREDLRIFHDILLETAKRDRFLVRSHSYFEALWDNLVPAGLGKVFMGRYQGESVAGTFAFVLGKQCWYTYGASSNQHRNVMPNYLIQWRMIQWAKLKGCEVYDFRGVSPQSEGEATEDHLAGLNRFKSGFGARYVEYIGEFDLPLSRVWYPVWTKGKPLAMRLMKRQRSNEQTGE